MKNRIIGVLLLALFATIGISKSTYAAIPAGATPVDSNAKVHICETLTNVHQDVDWEVYDYYPTDDTSAEFRSPAAWPLLPDGIHITYVPGTTSYTTCSDYYFNKQPNTEAYIAADAAPGLYHYVIDDRAMTPVDGFSDHDGTKYDITFQLRNTVDADNNITGKEAVLLYIKKDGQKVDTINFTRSADDVMSNINIQKTVKGTLGDINKYFPFTVVINGTAGASYTVSGAASGSGSPASCAAGANCVVYLKHGDSVRIGYDSTGSNQIPAGTTYTVTEGDNTGYTTSYSVGSGSATTGSATGTETVDVSASNNLVKFTNTKDGSPLTGIFTNILPFILLGVVSVFGAIIFKKNYAKKSK